MSGTRSVRPAFAGRWVVGVCLCGALGGGCQGAAKPAEKSPLSDAAHAGSRVAKSDESGSNAVDKPASKGSAPPPDRAHVVPLSGSPGDAAHQERAPEPAARFARDEALGNDSLSGLGALMGDAVGSNYGFGGLGMRGTGSGGGAVRERLGNGQPSLGRHAQATTLSMTRAASFNTERYAHQEENAFEHTADAPLSTFAVDVDTASYSNVRRFLNSGQRPPASAVRIEEMINYFQYEDREPTGKQPLSVTSQVAAAPWAKGHRLVRIALRTRTIDSSATPPRNLVFLIDVSGSMDNPDKLPLLQRGLRLLTENLRPRDRVAMVVYAGASGLVLPSTPGSERNKVFDALQRLRAGGSTNGGDGIRLAYKIARENFIKGGINRVILGTDGDFNVGTTSLGELTRLIEQERKHRVFLTVLGFGRGNLADATMEALADHGNGSYAYIDSVAEAQKTLVREAGSTLVTVAKDVKLQVEWNPKHVQSYRLLGFENRLLAAQDFNDDTKDAGELGAGHSMTALYEVVPRATTGQATAAVDPLRYQTPRATTEAADSDELLTLKIRYKQPDADTSAVLSTQVRDPGDESQATRDLRWSAAVACFGMLLRDSPHKGEATLALADALARQALGKDPHGDRHELVRLISLARSVGVGESAPRLAN